MLKYTDLQPNKFYTMIGTNMMAVTVAQTIQFIKISEAGSIIFKRIEKTGLSKQLYTLPPNKYEYLDGSKTSIGIWTDAEIPCHSGYITFRGDNNINICAKASDVDKVKAILEQGLSEDYKSRVCLFVIDEKTNTRSDEGEMIFDTENQLIYK